MRAGRQVLTRPGQVSRGDGRKFACLAGIWKTELTAQVGGRYSVGRLAVRSVGTDWMRYGARGGTCPGSVWSWI